MSSSSFPPNIERERLEKKLLEKMQAAERAYRAAAAEYKSIRAEFADMLDHPDGTAAVSQAALHERVAVENYRRALRAFTDFILHGRLPPEND